MSIKVDDSITSIINVTAREYFSNLNPIAVKIATDIEKLKSSYEHIWDEFNTAEQNDIINETLMKPEITLRYFDNFSSSSPSSISLSSAILNNNDNDDDDDEDDGGNGDGDDHIKPKVKTTKDKICYDKLTNVKNVYNFDSKKLNSYCKQKTGMKVIHDETIGVFRDEHSIPFSYKTKSQINLNLFVVAANQNQQDTKDHPTSLLKIHKKKDTQCKDTIDGKIISSESSMNSPARLLSAILTGANEENKQKLNKVSGTENRSNLLSKLMSSKNDLINFHKDIQSLPTATNNTTNKDKDFSSIVNQQISPNNDNEEDDDEYFDDSHSGTRLVLTQNNNISSSSLIPSNTGNNNGNNNNNKKRESSGGWSMRTVNEVSKSEETEDDYDKQKIINEETTLLLKDVEFGKNFDFLNNW